MRAARTPLPARCALPLRAAAQRLWHALRPARAAGDAAEQLVRRARVLFAVATAAVRSAVCRPLPPQAAPRPLPVKVVCHAVLSRPFTAQQHQKLTEQYAAQSVALTHFGQSATQCCVHVCFWTLAAGPPDVDACRLAR